MADKGKDVEELANRESAPKRRNVLRELGRRFRTGVRRSQGRLTEQGAQALGKPELAGISISELRVVLGLESPDERELLKAKIGATRALQKQREERAKLRSLGSLKSEDEVLFDQALRNLNKSRLFAAGIFTPDERLELINTEFDTLKSAKTRAKSPEGKRSVFKRQDRTVISRQEFERLIKAGVPEAEIRKKAVVK